MGRIAAAFVVTGAFMWAFLVPIVSAPAAWACVPGESPEILCSNEQQFINALAAEGVTPTRGARALVNLGWMVCGDLTSGRTTDVEWNRVYAYNPGMGPKGSQAVVNSAVAIFCPYATDPRLYHPPGYQNWNLP